jgi:hypothetical protein
VVCRRILILTENVGNCLPTLYVKSCCEFLNFVFGFKIAVLQQKTERWFEAVAQVQKGKNKLGLGKKW